MGMYDFLGEEQVKIFYLPIFNRNKEKKEESTYWHSGGQLRSFIPGDELPLKTLYYQYPESFMVYDYYFDNTDVWIVKDGAFVETVEVDSLTDEQVNCPVYDYHGNELTISTANDFSDIKVEHRLTLEKMKQVEFSFFQKGAIDAIKNDLAYFQSKEAEYRKSTNAVREEYSSKWYKKVENQHCIDFGSFLECFFYLRLRKDDKPFRDIILPADDYEACRATLKRLMKHHSGLVEEYREWVQDEEMLKAINFDTLIDEISWDK
ncbi:hypothetical protein ACFVS2_21270 [Brevibacillus sp. NPDC058079]|uniref:hypothetical protein n=1 Tax=Brevibacillus sp. NPDC058079 TaxID=3346330 RepID=UPI0036E18968